MTPYGRLAAAILARTREPQPGEEVVTIGYFRIVSSSTQPPNIVTMRSFRRDGTVLDEAHLLVDSTTASRPAVPTNPDADAILLGTGLKRGADGRGNGSQSETAPKYRRGPVALPPGSSGSRSGE